MASGNGSKNAGTAAPARLETRFPVNSSWEFVLQSQEIVEGRIYCTDDMSQTVVLQTALTHTVLASEIRMIHAAHIVKATQLKTIDAKDENPLSAPLPKIQKKVLEEREKKALKMVEESLRHINEKVRFYTRAFNFGLLIKSKLTFYAPIRLHPKDRLCLISC